MKDFQIGLCGKNKNNQILQNFFKNVDRYYQTNFLNVLLSYYHYCHGCF